MNSTTYQMAKANISKYDDFYCDQVVQVLQRLLRSIPDAKACLGSIQCNNRFTNQ